MEELKQKTYKCVLEDWRQFDEIARVLRGRHWAYRGQENATWGLWTTVEREWFDSKVNAKKRQYELLSRSKKIATLNIEPTFQRYISGDIEYADELSAIKDFSHLAIRQFPYDKDDYVNWLAVMQHFGGHTRLLDFSYSLFVALFFAFEKRTTSGNRAVWCVNLDSVYRYAREQISQYGIRIKRDDDYVSIANKIIGMGKKFSSDIYGVIPVRLLGNNERIDAQAGMFLFPVSQSGFTMNLANSLGVEEQYITQQTHVDHNAMIDIIQDDAACLIKLEFEHDMQQDAWNVLDQTNITARSLFPGLEGLARSIRVKF